MQWHLIDWKMCAIISLGKIRADDFEERIKNMMLAYDKLNISIIIYLFF